MKIANYYFSSGRIHFDIQIAGIQQVTGVQLAHHSLAAKQHIGLIQRQFVPPGM
ncbi:MAG: hypothetical protein ACI8QT_001496 [Halioglobus sp.]|jgi:hypothetical protein